MDIQLTEDQAGALRSLLDEALGDMSAEIADTDNPGFRGGARRPAGPAEGGAAGPGRGLSKPAPPQVTAAEARRRAASASATSRRTTSAAGSTAVMPPTPWPAG